MELASHLPPPEKSNLTSLILSATVHLLLIGALFFGVQWKSQAPSAVQVEVWRAAPAVVAPVAKPEPIHEPPPEPKAEPKPTPKPAPKAEPAPTIKPDIALKDEKKPKKEEPKKPEPKKPEPKKEEPKKEEPKKPEPKKEEAKKPEPKPVAKIDPAPKPSEPDRLQSKLDEADRELKQTQRLKERQAQLARAGEELDQMKQQSAAKKRGDEAYRNAIRNAIRGNIVLPQGIQGNPKALFEVTQLPNGDILKPVRILQSSGNPALDAAIERAILKSSPLPKPPSQDLFERVMKIWYQPYDQE